MNTPKIAILATLLFAATTATIATAGEPYVHQFGKTAFDGSQYDPAKSPTATRNRPDQPIRQDLQYFGAKTEQELKSPGFPFGAMTGAILGESIVPGINGIPYQYPYYNNGWYNNFRPGQPMFDFGSNVNPFQFSSE